MIEVIRAAANLQKVWSYIFFQLTPLAELKGSPEIVEQLEKRRSDFEQ